MGGGARGVCEGEEPEGYMRERSQRGTWGGGGGGRSQRVCGGEELHVEGYVGERSWRGI